MTAVHTPSTPFDDYSEATAVYTPLTSTTIAPLVLESVPSRADQALASQIERLTEDTLEWPMVVQQLTEHAANDDEIAQDLLTCIFSDHQDRGVRSKGEIVKMCEEVTSRRNAFLQNRARQLSEDPNSHYSEEEWFTWLSGKCLDKDDMDAAVKAWKKDFEQTNFKEREKCKAWRLEGSKASKQNARNLLNGAFKSHLRQVYGRYQLAFAFLECPATMVDTLLNKWAMHMQSPEYQAEVQRARKGRHGPEKDSEVAAKVAVYQLRYERRRAQLLTKRLQSDARFELSKWDKQVYERYLKGDICRELDDAKRKHGYGTLSTGEILRPSGPKYVERIEC